MKKKGLFDFLSLVLITFIAISPTFGKYDGTLVGEAGKLVFTTLTFSTDSFIVTDFDIKNDDGTIKEQYKDEVPKWGTNSEAAKEGKDQGMDSLQNVEFSIDNKSSQDLLVMFYIDFKINVIKNIGSSFNISIRNIDNNETLTGSVQFTNYDSDGWFLWTSYYYDGTVDPRNLSAESGNKEEIINRSFVAHGTNSAGSSSLSFQVSINFENSGIGDLGDLLTDSNYLNVNMIVVPYNG